MTVAPVQMITTDLWEQLDYGNKFRKLARLFHDWTEIPNCTASPTINTVFYFTVLYSCFSTGVATGSTVS